MWYLVESLLSRFPRRLGKPPAAIRTMPTRPIIALGVILFLFLSSCESTQSQIRALTRPSYSGPVAAVDQPITIKVAPLNRKAESTGETITQVISGSKVQQSYMQGSGTVESYQFGDNVQINYILDRVGDGRTFQPFLPFIIQFEMDRNGKLQNLNFGGKILDQAKPDQRDALQALGKSFARGLAPTISSQPLAQGDVWQSYRIFDKVKEMFAEMKVEPTNSPFKLLLAETTSSGSGIIARLAGKTTFDGRPAYLILWDGNEVVSDAKKSVTMTFSGYSLIDAATGLYSASHTLLKVSGQSSNGILTFEELTNNRLKF